MVWKWIQDNAREWGQLDVNQRDVQVKELWQQFGTNEDVRYWQLFNNTIQSIMGGGGIMPKK